MHIILGVFWLCAGVTLMVFALQNKPVAGLDASRTQIIAVLALILAAYNAVRWFASRNRRPPEEPPPSQKGGHSREQQEYLPQFDFERRESAPPKNTSENGPTRPPG